MHRVVANGAEIPAIGLGTWTLRGAECARIVEAALEVGYRHIDTAAMYNNEAGVGAGVRASGVPREEIFVTTKLWSTDQGRDAALAAFERSERELDLGPVDLYMIHWPSPRRGLFVETWRVLIRLQEEGRIRSIGVSNFEKEHLERLIVETGVAPAINQIECHPRFQQHALHAVNAQLGIASESWGPLGRGPLLEDPVLLEIARKHGRTAAQVVIRWHVQSGLVVIPKSSKAERIRANFDVLGFELDDEDLAKIAAMDDPAGRVGPDPLMANW